MRNGDVLGSEVGKSASMLSDLGLLVARSVIGLSFAAHGSQKAFGWFGGPGRQGAAGFMESLGFRPGDRYAALSSYTELTAGLLMALGLGGPLGPGMLVSVMVVAQRSVHMKNGYFATNGGIELGLMYVAAAVALASSGYGGLSLDRTLRFGALEDERLALVTLLGGAVAGAITLSQRSSGDSSEATS